MNDLIALHAKISTVCTHIRQGEPMDKHTSFRIGGKAALVAFPITEKELVDILHAHAEISPHLPLCVLGNGSNVVFADEGFNGLVVLTGGMRSVHIDDDPTPEGYRNIIAESGASLTALAGMCMKENVALSGLEFAYGIPGSIGGAVVMNAGAYGGEMSDVVIGCDFYDPANGQIHHLSRESLDFSYRHSIFSIHPEWVVVRVKLALCPENATLIRARSEANMTSRREKQPLDFPNAGSVFKRPQGHFAGKLIEDCGLKGYTVGDAQISEKHAGFIINRGKATARDIKTLVTHIQSTVKNMFGVCLECEIRFIG